MYTNHSIKKIIITGGAGYLGSSIVSNVPESTEIVVIDNFHIDTEYKRENSKDLQKNRNVKVIEANVSETELYSHELHDVDVIIYMASLNSYKESNANPQLYLRENVVNLQMFLDAVHKNADRIKKCILTSSRGVYGEGPYMCQTCGVRMNPYLSEKPVCRACGSTDISAQIITEEDLLSPSSYYGLSKKFQEDVLTLYCIQQSIPLDILRIFNVYGKDQGNYYSNIGIIPQIYTQIVEKKEMYLNGNGLLARDFVSVEDVVHILSECISDPSARKNLVEIYNVGSGNPTTINDIADFFEGLGYNFTRNNITAFDDIKYSVADNKKALKKFKLKHFRDILDFLRKTYKNPV